MEKKLTEIGGFKRFAHTPLGEMPLVGSPTAKCFVEKMRGARPKGGCGCGRGHAEIITKNSDDNLGKF